MKKAFITALCILAFGSVLANSNDVYVADIQYDWIDKSEVER